MDFQAIAENNRRKTTKNLTSAIFMCSNFLQDISYIISLTGWAFFMKNWIAVIAARLGMTKNRNSTFFGQKS